MHNGKSKAKRESVLLSVVCCSGIFLSLSLHVHVLSLRMQTATVQSWARATPAHRLCTRRAERGSPAPWQSRLAEPPCHWANSCLIASSCCSTVGGAGRTHHASAHRLRLDHGSTDCRLRIGPDTRVDWLPRVTGQPASPAAPSTGMHASIACCW